MIFLKNFVIILLHPACKGILASWEFNVVIEGQGKYLDKKL